jgi:transcriptional regulator NrdR family protein
VTCQRCGGSGEVVVQTGTLKERNADWRKGPCPECGGNVTRREMEAAVEKMQERCAKVADGKSGSYTSQSWDLACHTIARDIRSLK